MKNAASEKVLSKDDLLREFFSVINSSRPKEGFDGLRKKGTLGLILPELEEGIRQVNRPAHLTVWEHNLNSLAYAAEQNYSEEIRLAALLHDIGKPRVAEKVNEIWTFHNHEVVGAKMAKEILERLKVNKKNIEKILILIRWHLFRYESEEATTDSSVRRLIKRVGAENMSDLVRLRICDRMGMGVPKAVPYRLRHFQFRVEKILREEDKFTPKKLKLKGGAVMKILSISPGPKIGKILNVLTEEIARDPLKNAKKHLESRVKELGKLSDRSLDQLVDSAEMRLAERETKRIDALKGKYYVK